MLAHHPETGQPIRILKTGPVIYSDGKTLVWIRAGFKASNRWGRWNIVVSEPAAVSICGADAVGFIALSGDAKPEDWRGVWGGLFGAGSSTLFVAPAAVVTAFDAAGLRTDRTFVTEDLYDSYPYIGEPLSSSDELTKVILSIAHMLRQNRIAWTVGTDREVFSFGVRAQLDAWARVCCTGGTPALIQLAEDATDEVVPRTWLIQQYYVDSNHRRAREIRSCLDRNLACDYIDYVLLLNESAHDLPVNPKLQTILLGHRLRYYDVLVAARERVPAGDYIIFANSDICFNDTLSHLWKIQMVQSRLFLALLRWEDGEVPAIFGPRADSQDAWILARDCLDFEPALDDFGFPFGKPGCDNAISLIMMRRKFMIVNPAYSIKTIHVHASQIRRYNPRDVLYRTHYLYVDPTAIQGFSVISDMSDKAYRSPAAVTEAWNAARLGRSFPRPILCDSDASTVCSMLRREGRWNYAATDANLWTPPPVNSPLYKINGGCFVSADGLVCNFRSIFTGGHAEWVRGWESAVQSTLMPCVHVPHLIAVPFDAAWSKSLGQWALHYLPRALAVREAVRKAGQLAPEFLVPQVDSIGAFLADCKWSGADSRGNITVVPYLDDSNYFVDHVWATPPAENNLPTTEDISLLRGLLPVAPCCDNKPIVVFCVEDAEDAICTRSWAESVADNLFHTGWTVRYIGEESMPAARRKAFSDASWIFGGGAGLEWIWMAGTDATVMEFVRDYEPHGETIHLAGAAGLRYILGPVKKEPLVNQRQNALLAAAAAFGKHGFRTQLALSPATAEKNPVIILPSASALSGIFSHAGDTFREMAAIWAERGYVTLEHREDTPYCWWGGIGQILLYDRPTPRWWPAVPPTYQMALFGNCAPPGPGPHLLKQSVWSFWGRSPRMLEGVATRVENMQGYESRAIKSLFIGKIENGVQHAARTGVDWSAAVELFSMPIDTTGKPYPYTQAQYLEKLCNARFGLCLPGYGPKCNREIEYFCCGTVPIVTPGVDMKGYLIPPKEGVHYFCASTPEEVRRIVETTAPERWAAMSAACREWWRSNASAEGFFRLTLVRIAQCRPYLNVGIPPSLKL
jgi:hypothetical protein